MSESQINRIKGLRGFPSAKSESQIKRIKGFQISLGEIYAIRLIRDSEKKEKEMYIPIKLL